MKILHVINDLHTGGAEMMLLKLLSVLDREAYEPAVMSLISIGPIGERIRSLGIPVRSLGMRNGVPDLRAVLWLARLIRQERHKLVQTWLYHSDLIGGLAAKLAGGPPVVWNIRNSDLCYKRMTFLTVRACARLSRWLPARILCCSESAGAFHAAMGYVADKIVHVPNGFDLEAFRPDPAARDAVRRELGIPEAAPLIGLVGRFDPQKDHATFIQAAARLGGLRPDVHFLLCGNRVDWENSELAAEIARAGIRDRCRLLGSRSDMPRIQASLDIATSSSACGEAFSNAIGEAMAAGVPCVVTDVGDSAAIVGPTGRVVPTRDPEALVRAWQSLLELAPERRGALGAAARDRIGRHFSLAAIAARYAALYDEIAAARTGPTSRRLAPDVGCPT
jgi:glycosyltransferase involved in cell wall biosynthesis